MKYLKLIENESEIVPQEYGVLYALKDGGIVCKKAQEPQPQPNEIWYTTTNNNTVELSEYWEGEQPISNVFDGTKCIMTFADPIIDITEAFDFDGREEDETQLVSVTLPNGVENIGNYAFNWCSNLTSVTIPNSVTSIGNQAFASCSNLTSVTIPNGVVNIGSYAFGRCSSLTSITVDPQNTVYHSDGNCCMKDGEVVFGCSTSVIPTTATSISDGAFASCSNLTSVTIGNSVTSIGNNAFQSCTNLTSVTIPNSVTSISDSTFQSCTNLTSVTIPNSVTSISDRAFNSCISLTSVTYSGTIAQWNAITKGNYWKSGVPSTCMVHCTDGDIAI